MAARTERKRETHTFTRARVHPHAYTQTHMLTHMHTDTHICTYIYTNIHTYTHTSLALPGGLRWQVETGTIAFDFQGHPASTESEERYAG